MRDSISQASSLTCDNIHDTRVFHTILKKVTLNYLCIADLSRKCSYERNNVRLSSSLIVSLRTGFVLEVLLVIFNTRQLSKTSEPLSLT